MCVSVLFVYLSLCACLLIPYVSTGIVNLFYLLHRGSLELVLFFRLKETACKKRNSLSVLIFSMNINFVENQTSLPLF